MAQQCFYYRTLLAHRSVQACSLVKSKYINGILIVSLLEQISAETRDAGVNFLLVAHGGNLGGARSLEGSRVVR
jgi:hypothetical protein